jgi:hypothetical protein
MAARASSRTDRVVVQRSRETPEGGGRGSPGVVLGSTPKLVRLLVLLAFDMSSCTHSGASPIASLIARRAGHGDAEYEVHVVTGRCGASRRGTPTVEHDYVFLYNCT